MKISNRFSLLIKLTKWVFIPAALIGIWLFLTLTKNPDVPFSILLNQSKINNISGNYYFKILKGESVIGQFVSKDDNLGSIKIKFSPMNKVKYEDEDVIVFKIRFVNESNWFYQNKYKSGSIFENPEFPFGFPVVVNSKNKEFQFEITSLNGNRDNAVTISKNNLTLVTVHQYSRTEITENQMSVTNFLIKKLINTFSKITYLASSLTYLLPFVAYLYLIFFNKRSKKYILLIGTFIAIDCLLIDTVHNLLFFGVSFLWIIIVIRSKETYKSSFRLALFFIVFSFILLLLNQKTMADKASLWCYMFLAVGTIQAALRVRNTEK